MDTFTYRFGLRIGQKYSEMIHKCVFQGAGQVQKTLQDRIKCYMAENYITQLRPSRYQNMPIFLAKILQKQYFCECSSFRILEW